MAKRQRLVLIEKPGAYLVSIARNLLTDRARADNARQSSQHHSFEDEEIAGPDPHAALGARDTMRRDGEEIETLKPQTASIFVSHRFDGMSYEEDAKRQGHHVTGVDWQLAKAITEQSQQRTQ